MSKQWVCIVDAYSTGAELAQELGKYGYGSIHVQSTSQIDKDLLSTFRADDFKENFVFEGKLDELLAKIEVYKPQYVIAGTETGVILSDLLAHSLLLPGNDPQTSHYRRNKFEMNNILKERGLLSVEQARFSTTQAAIDWAVKRNIWPVVVKPLDSAGTDHVYFSENNEEVRAACDSILHQYNRMGSYNNEVLLQEYLNGQQYFVNAVSCNGNHVVTEIWKDIKKRVDGASMICDKEELLPYHGEIQNKIVKYIKEALDILGVKEGASHSELMYTEKGPVLIETAARMQGTILHNALIESIGDSHVTTTVERYVFPDKFMERMNRHYTINKNLFCITLASNETGVVVENNVAEKLKELVSFYAVFHTPKPGETIERTIDLFSNPGIIYLLHEDREQILKDYEQIRKWEDSGAFFKVAVVQNN